MYYHTRKSRKLYKSFTPPNGCDFCDTHNYADQIKSETEFAYVIANRTFYSHWELRTVTDHLLIIPKRHVFDFSELNRAERADIMDIMADYEGQGYDIYARSPKSVSRSVPHQHTHIIKTTDKPSLGMFFLSKPYILFRFR